MLVCDFICYDLLFLMNSNNLRLASEIINPSYITLAENALNTQQNIITNLLSQRQLP